MTCEIINQGTLSMTTMIKKNIFDDYYKGFCNHYKITPYVIGSMLQTGPKKCFLPQNLEKYTSFDSTEHSLCSVH